MWRKEEDNKMSMIYDEKNRLWKLDTPNTSYVLGLVDGRFLAHIYYGAKVTDTDLTYILRLNEGWRVPSKQPEEYVSFMSALPMELSVFSSSVVFCLRRHILQRLVGLQQRHAVARRHRFRLGIGNGKAVRA